MANRFTRIQAFVESARAAAQSGGMPITQVLADVRNAIFNGELRDGKVLIGSAEAGGSITFTVPPGHSPLEIMELLQEAINWCHQFPNPENPTQHSRRIRRLRVSFAKAPTQ